MNSNFGSNVVGAILSSILIAVAGALFLNHYWKQIRFAKQMQRYHINDISLSITLRKQMRKVFKEASTIKILYVTGHKFIEMNDYFEIAKKRKNQPKIRYLLSSKSSDFIKEIEMMEKVAGIRNVKTDIGDDVESSLKQLNELQSGLSYLKYKQFNTEYRLPVIIAEYNEGRTRKRQVWLPVTLPPYKSKRNITLFGEDEVDIGSLNQVDKKGEFSDDLNVVEMAEIYFDSIWENIDNKE